jgi:uncharacterized peroxidase-related enzyme
MSRISNPAPEVATGVTAELFAQIRKAAGKVPNAYAAIGALKPAALKAILQADALLATGGLSRQDQETIKLTVSAATGCDYCVAAHSFVGGLVGLAPKALAQIRSGQPTGDAKRDALAHLVRTLVHTSGTISGDEFAAIKAVGYTDVELVDISLAVAVITFTNVFNRINDTTLDFPEIA